MQLELLQIPVLFYFVALQSYFIGASVQQLGLLVFQFASFYFSYTQLSSLLCFCAMLLFCN